MEYVPAMQAVHAEDPAESHPGAPWARAAFEQPSARFTSRSPVNGTMPIKTPVTLMAIFQPGVPILKPVGFQELTTV